MSNIQSLALFNSYVEQLRSVYNDKATKDIDEAVLNQDAGFVATKDRIASFLDVYKEFDLVQTYSCVPSDEKWDDEVVQALCSNDYKTLIKKLNVNMQLDKPTAIQVILDNVISDDTFGDIQGGILFAYPTATGIDAYVSVFVSEGEMGMGITHLTEKFKLQKTDGEYSFAQAESGVEAHVCHFSTFLLMQIPYYLALKADHYEAAYTHLVMSEESDNSLSDLGSKTIV